MSYPTFKPKLKIHSSHHTEKDNAGVKNNEENIKRETLDGYKNIQQIKCNHPHLHKKIEGEHSTSSRLQRKRKTEGDARGECAQRKSLLNLKIHHPRKNKRNQECIKKRI